MVRPWLERISGRIAVSDFARRVQVEHLGGDAVIIPNGVHVAAFAEGPVPARVHARASTGRRSASSAGSTSRARGCRSCSRRCGPSSDAIPGARLLIAGRGDAAVVQELIGEDLRAHVALLGEISEADKAAFLRSVDIYCAPNLLGESFGVILIEALAAGAPIVASDLDAFARVLDDGRQGCWSAVGTPERWRRALCDLLADPARRAELSGAGAGVAAEYDWDVLARRILAVYETVVLPDGGGVLPGDDDEELPVLPGGRAAG